MWHVSLSIRIHSPETAPLLVTDWLGTPAHRLVELAALASLKGAGQPPDRRDRGRTVVHLRRALNDREMTRLPAGFLDRPAIDLAGGEGLAW